MNSSTSMMTSVQSGQINDGRGHDKDLKDGRTHHYFKVAE